MSQKPGKWRNSTVGITRWVSNQVDQLIGTVPLEDLNRLTVEKKTPVVETHPTATEETDTGEKIVTTRRISLSSEEKMFVEHVIFSAPIHTTRNEILDLILDDISSISGVKRERSTIKYYIYNSVERKKPENRPYRLVFGLKRYSIKFKEQAIQEAIKLGQLETQLKFALPSATLAGWVDKHTLDTALQMQKDLEQPVTTEDKSSSPKTVENVLQQNTTTVAPKTPESSPVDEDVTNILDALIQMQSTNKDLTAKIHLHIKELAEVKKQIMSDFFFKEKSCKDLISMVTATEANIEGALTTLVKIETAAQKTKRVRKTAMTGLNTTNAELRKEGGKLRLRQEQVQQDLQDVIRNLPKIN
jgi:hypothetical protein